MARLPRPGGDSGTWGDVLNDYLSQAHKPDGTLQDSSVTANVLAPNSVSNAAIASNAVNATSIADGSITNSLLADGTLTEAKLSSAVQSKLNTTASIADGSIVKAKLEIAVQDSLVKADSALQSAPVISVAAQTGAVTLTSADVGLGNVDNTSDATKPISSATQSALNGKAPLASPTFTGSVTVPTPTNSGDATTKAYVDSAAAGSTPDAGTNTKGKLQLAGDLGGTASAPSVGTSNGVPIVTTTGTQTLTNKSITGSQITSAVANATTAASANALKSATTTIVINGAAAPAIGQILMASSSTSASWVTPTTSSVVIAGLSELSTNTVTAGTAVTVVLQVAFVATGSPVRIKLAGGSFTAASAVAITWDLYDPILSKTIRQSVRTYATASSSEPLPSLERIFTPASGDYVVQFRVKPASNIAITIYNSLTSPDESTLQLTAETVGIA